MAFECMDDCIHLHACRRIQKIGKKFRLLVPRYCTEDCSCYVNGTTGNYITINQAVRYAMNGAQSIRDGYDEYDVYIPQDLTGMTLHDIINDLEQDEEG